MKRTPYATYTEGLKALAELGDMEFVNSMKDKVNSNRKYIPNKDYHLMKWLTESEKKQFITLM